MLIIWTFSIVSHLNWFEKIKSAQGFVTLEVDHCLGIEPMASYLIISVDMKLQNHID